ncbi:hypothetical protein [Mycolicibacterium phlei]|uniref:hypothetical protein n=1 Tax=Mycolicibacterium phlei TaxID=1771 RepID=UPI0037C8C1C7
MRSDTSSLAEIEALADRVRDEFATVDALVANAGIGSFDAFFCWRRLKSRPEATVEK